MSFLVRSVAGTFNAGNLVASDAAGVTTNGFVLTLVAGVPTWLVAPGASAAVVFDDSVPAAQVNIRSNRATNQTTLQNTDAGITNFGSNTFGGARTVNGNYATLGGGNGNQIGAAGLGSAFSTISGGRLNIVGNSVQFGTISGGTGNTASGALAPSIGGGDSNVASSNYSTVAGGTANTEAGSHGFIGGGTLNTVAAGTFYGTIGGGFTNGISGGLDGPTIGGGTNNVASSQVATVSGGSANTASALGATVGGGVSCIASARETFAHGSSARATRSGQYAHGGDQTTDLPGYGRVIYKGKTTVAGGASQVVELLLGPDAAQFTPGNNKAFALFIEMVVAGNGIGAGTPTSAAFTFFTTMAANLASTTFSISALVALAAPVGDPVLVTCTLATAIVAGKLKLTFTGPVAPTASSVTAVMRFSEITHS